MKKNILFGLLAALVLSGCTVEGSSKSMDGSTNNNVDKRSLVGSVVVDKDTILFDSRSNDPVVVKVNVNGTYDYDKTAKILVDDPSIVSLSATEIESNSTFTVTPVKVGEAIITVQSVQDESKAASIDVRVEETKATLDLSPKTKTLTYGQEFTLEAQSNTTDEIEWTIDAGGEVFVELQNIQDNQVKVVAKNAEGHARVRATTEFLTDVCEIDVQKPSQVSKDLYFTKPDSWNKVYAQLIKPNGDKDSEAPGIELTEYTINDFNERVYSKKDIDLSQFDKIKFSNGTDSTPVISIFEMGDKNNIFIPGSDLTDVHYGTYVEPTPYVSFAVNSINVYKGYEETIMVTSGHGDVQYINESPSVVSVVSGTNSQVVLCGVSVSAEPVKVKAKIGSVVAELDVTVSNRPTPTVGDIGGLHSIEEFTSTDLTCVANLNGVNWSIKSGSEYVSLSNPIGSKDTGVYTVTVKGLNAGTAVITATNETASKDFSITITPCNEPQTLYFTNNGSWSEVYLYAFKNGAGTENHEWPGVQLEDVVKNKFGEDVYVFTMNPSVFDMIKFDSGSDGSKTVNIPVKDLLRNKQNNVYVDFNQEQVDGEYKVGYANYEAPDEVYARFESHSSTLIVNQQAHINVDTNVYVTYECDDLTVVSILNSNTRQLTVKGLKSGEAHIVVKIDGVIKDTVTIEVTSNTIKDFYFYNAYETWTSFSYYLFKDKDHEASSWPGTLFTGDTYRDQFGDKCYKVAIDVEVYPYVIINAYNSSEHDTKQTRTISLNDVLSGGHDTISMDTTADWVIENEKYVNPGKFETFVPYDATQKFTLYLDTGNNLWNQANATFFIHAWGSPLLNDDFDAKLTFVSGNIYSVQIDKSYRNYVFVRMPENSESIDWDNCWNKTEDLVRQTTNNCYTISGWGGDNPVCPGSWGIH